MRITFFCSVVSITAFLTDAASVPPPYVLHEKRGSPLLSWVKRDRISSKVVLPMRIGLTQSNLHRGYELLMDVSDPQSSNYGKHKTQEEVISLFRPSDAAVEAVLNWLTTSGISRSRIIHSDNKGWLAFDATSGEAESLLHTKYHNYEHLDTGNVIPGCESYHLPKHVRRHIDYIMPGLRLLAITNDKRSLKEHVKADKGKPMSGSTDQPLKFLSIQQNIVHSNTVSDALSVCDRRITPDCIKALYQVPTGTKNATGNAMGIFEYLDAYSQSDLNLFYSTYSSSISQNFGPTVRPINGGVAPVTQNQSGIESSLDLQVSVPLLYPQGTLIYQVGSGGTFDSLLDAIDGSYCTVTDSNPKSVQCGVYNPANVISISYGGQEADLSASYQQRQCNEFMKLGLQGKTVIFASGDNGVAGPPGSSAHQNNNGCLGKTTNPVIFNPGWPNTCPYVTNVGATKVMPNRNVTDPEWAVVDPPGLPYTSAFSSGGGFSNIYSAPSYQIQALKTYFTKYAPSYKFYNLTKGSSDTIGSNNGVYNRAGRGYPDVAANGDNIIIYNKGVRGTSGGTSASAPIFAAIINLINEERLAMGKSTVGFVNPALYANPGIMNDIVNGSNPGCGTAGFTAVPGWDPVSGLGTPNYPKMVVLFKSL